MRNYNPQEEQDKINKHILNENQDFEIGDVVDFIYINKDKDEIDISRKSSIRSDLHYKDNYEVILVPYVLNVSEHKKQYAVVVDKKNEFCLVRYISKTGVGQRFFHKSVLKKVNKRYIIRWNYRFKNEVELLAGRIPKVKWHPSMLGKSISKESYDKIKSTRVGFSYILLIGGMKIPVHKSLVIKIPVIEFLSGEENAFERAKKDIMNRSNPQRGVYSNSLLEGIKQKMKNEKIHIDNDTFNMLDKYKDQVTGITSTQKNLCIDYADLLVAHDKVKDKLNKTKEDGETIKVHRLTPTVGRGDRPRGEVIYGRTSKPTVESGHFTNRKGVINR